MLEIIYRQGFYPLHTQRLDLIALSPVHLRQYLAGPAQLEQELGFPISRAVITARVVRAIGMKLVKLEAVQPDRFAWYTYWLVVIRAVPFGAGLAGFKGFPDPDGEAEIGYGYQVEYRIDEFEISRISNGIGSYVIIDKLSHIAQPVVKSGDPDLLLAVVLEGEDNKREEQENTEVVYE